MTRLLHSLAVLAAAGALLAGCGDDNNSDDSAAPAASDTTATEASTGSSASSGTASDLRLAASEDGGLSFDKKTLSAKAGTVTITMDNPSGDQMPHAIAIDGNGVDKDGEVVQPGGKSTVSVDLKPGKYTFYCPVGQHRQNGMEGTLTVQ
ncbi:plastocyanin/azurin family copper-binding protein [Baekduia sp. Peel2402]|uniref:plastocyanin/azurin family copper-binding protein n=1 Tax=Baekduia sp. Peel2402 TaxID=3458296 RepID=UPI00403EBCD1